MASTTFKSNEGTRSDSPRSDQPGIIIGAGRSGTNMLRDLLVGMPQFATWPCDEINYLWRHGNRRSETDEFSREMADSYVKSYIRRKFLQFAKKSPDAMVIEKTCANSLRCGFVHEVFPSARFIHIVRDGRDVAASASLRWNAKLEIGYILKKVKFVPPTDLPWYAASYLKARMFRLFSGTSRLSSWGPKFEGMQEALRDNDLPIACAIQWRTCVESTLEQLGEIPGEQVLTIRYEAFTSNPEVELAKVCEFLGASVDPEQLNQVVSTVSPKSVGKWKSQLSEKQASAVEDHCGDLLRRLRYLA